MTVAELIAELAELPQDACVETEGCDCIGPCSGAELTSGKWGDLERQFVLLKRDDDMEMLPEEDK